MSGTAAAQGVDPYLAGDGVEVVLDGAIRQKALELGDDPVEIFEFVRNEIRFSNYWGLARGPVGTLRSLEGNDYDQATLLVSLLRSAGYRARFVRGQIQLNCKQVSGWLGVVTTVSGGDVSCAAGATFLQSAVSTGFPGGCQWCAAFDPVTTLTSVIHVWVEAEVPLADYRGRRQTTSASGRAWVPLEPSVKTAIWPSRVPELREEPIWNPLRVFDFTGYQAEVKAALPVEIYADQIQTYLNAHNVKSSFTGSRLLISELYRDGEVAKVAPGVLPLSLPHAIGPRGAIRGASLGALHQASGSYDAAIGLNEGGPSAYSHFYDVHICDDEYIKALPVPSGQDGATFFINSCKALANSHPSKLFAFEERATQWEGKSVVLQFLPASFPSGGFSSMGCGSQWNVTPKISVDGVALATTPAPRANGFCKKKLVVLGHRPPGTGVKWEFANVFESGGTYSLLFDLGSASSRTTRIAEEALLAANSQYPITDGGGADPAVVNDGLGLRLTAHPDAQRALIGGVLNLAGKRYAERVRTSMMQNASLHGQLFSPTITVGVVSASYRSVTLFGQIVGAEASDWLIDAHANAQPPRSAITGMTRMAPNSGAPTSYTATLTSGDKVNIHAAVLGVYEGSALEHAVWEELVGREAVSTVKGLQVGKEVFEANQLIVRPDAPNQCAPSTGPRCFSNGSATVEWGCTTEGISCSLVQFPGCVTIPDDVTSGCWAPNGPIACPNVAPCDLDFGEPVNPSEALNHLEFVEEGVGGPGSCLVASAFSSHLSSGNGEATSLLAAPLNNSDDAFFSPDEICSTSAVGFGEEHAALCRLYVTPLADGSSQRGVGGCDPDAIYPPGVPDPEKNCGQAKIGSVRMDLLAPTSRPEGRAWRWRLTGNWDLGNGMTSAMGSPTFENGPRLRPHLRVAGLPGAISVPGSGSLRAEQVDFLKLRFIETVGLTYNDFSYPPATHPADIAFDSGIWVYLDEYEIERAADIASRSRVLLSLDAAIVKRYQHGNDPDYVGYFARDMATQLSTSGGCGGLLQPPCADMSPPNSAGARHLSFLSLKDSGVVFDTIGCGPEWKPMVGSTTELRVLDKPFFSDYNGFKGYVYYRQSREQDDLTLSMTINPDLPQGAKGAYTTDYWSDPFRFNALDSIYSAPPLISSLSYNAQTFGFASPYLSNFSVGDPVSVAGGNFFDVTTDFTIAGRGGLDLRFVRAYNTRLKYSGDLGTGWIHSFEQRLESVSGAALGLDDPQLVWVDENGNETPWSVKATGFEPEPSNHSKLETIAGGGYRITTKEGMRYEFTPPAQGHSYLVSIADRNGNSIRIQRANDRVSKVIDSAGRELNFQNVTASNGSRTLTVTDWAGRSWRYHISTDGILDEFTDAEQIARGTNRAWRYSYYVNAENEALDKKLKCWVKPEGGRTPTPGVSALCGNDAQGHSWMFLEYYGNGTVQSHTDALGRKTRFAYDYFGKRTQVQYPDGTNEEYQFDKYANIVRHRDRNGVVKRFEFNEEKREQIKAWDGEGMTHLAHYDDQGNMNSRTDRVGKAELFEYNEFGQVTLHEDRRGHISETKYDFRGRPLLELKDLDGERRRFAEFEYDEYGNLSASTELRLPGSILQPARTEYQYDSLGVSPRTIREPLKGRVSIEVDAVGNPTKVSRQRTVTLESGESATSDVDVLALFDSLGRPTLASRPNASPADLRSHWVGAVRDADGNVTQECSWITPTRVAPATAHAPCTAPLGGLAAGVELRLDRSAAFDVMGQEAASTDALGRVTTVKRDAMDRVIETKTPLGRTHRVVYDGVGNITQEIAPSGRVTEYRYDGERRRTETIDALGHVSELVYDGEGRVLEEYGPEHRLIRKVVYDSNGNAVQIFDGANTETRNTYDELNRLRSQQIAVGKPEGYVVTFEYDLLGRLLSRTDGEGHALRVSYDANGRPTSQTDEVGRATAYLYDEAGSVTQVEMPDGRIIHSAFDDRGLLTRRWGEGVEERHAYDPRGRLVMSSTAEMRDVFEYDVLDRAVSVTNNFTGTSRVVFDEDGLVQNYVYPTGASYGFPEKLITRYVYDSDGLLSEVIDPDAGRWIYHRDEIGRELQRLASNGNSRRLTYHPTGFLASVENKVGSFSIVETYPAASYDPLGNPKEIIRGGSETTSITYDAHSRVKIVRYPSGAVGGSCGSAGWECFDYDRAGNRREHYRADGTRLQFNVDAADQLTSITNVVTGVAAASYEYDRAGRRTKKVEGSLEINYHYDALGRLIAAGSASGQPTTLAYGTGSTIFRRTDAAGTSYSFSGGIEKRLNNRIRAVGAGVDGRRIGEVWYPPSPAPPTAYEQMADGRGNVGLVALNSMPQWQGQYRAFGETFSESGIKNSELGFSGSRVEGFTGLIRMGARHYDPQTGRFIQSDPIGIKTDQLYAFASNNPYIFSDPSGLSPWRNTSSDWSLNRISLGGYSSFDRGRPSIGSNLWSSASSFGMGAAQIGLGLLPVVGDLYGAGTDIYDLASSSSSGWQRSIAGASLTANAFTLGVAPNAGPILRGLDSFASGFGDLYDAGRSVGRQVTILGENMANRVIPFADKTGARTLPFGATEEAWDAMSPAQRWKINDGALRARIREGDTFRYIGQDPFRDPLYRSRFDLTGSELLRLRDRGISYETVSPEEIMRVIGRP